MRKKIKLFNDSEAIANAIRFPLIETTPGRISEDEYKVSNDQNDQFALKEEVTYESTPVERSITEVLPKGFFCDLNLSTEKRTEELLVKANLQNTNLSGANLSSTNLSGANLSSTNLSFADLSGANLQKTNLQNANLSGANLSSTNLSFANLQKTNLQNANLSGANLSSTNLSFANLQNADLSLANLQNADLSGANLSGLSLADLKSAGVEPESLRIQVKNLLIENGKSWEPFVKRSDLKTVEAIGQKTPVQEDINNKLVIRPDTTVKTSGEKVATIVAYLEGFFIVKTPDEKMESIVAENLLRYNPNLLPKGLTLPDGSTYQGYDIDQSNNKISSYTIQTPTGETQEIKPSAFRKEYAGLLRSEKFVLDNLGLLPKDTLVRIPGGYGLIKKEVVQENGEKSLLIKPKSTSENEEIEIPAKTILRLNPIFTSGIPPAKIKQEPLDEENSTEIVYQIEDIKVVLPNDEVSKQILNHEEVLSALRLWIALIPIGLRNRGMVKRIEIYTYDRGSDYAFTNGEVIKFYTKGLDPSVFYHELAHCLVDSREQFEGTEISKRLLKDLRDSNKFDHVTEPTPDSFYPHESYLREVLNSKSSEKLRKYAWTEPAEHPAVLSEVVFSIMLAPPNLLEEPDQRMYKTLGSDDIKNWEELWEEYPQLMEEFVKYIYL